jgi:hypothetical protein
LTVVVVVAVELEDAALERSGHGCSLVDLDGLDSPRSLPSSVMRSWRREGNSQLEHPGRGPSGIEFNAS